MTRNISETPSEDTVGHATFTVERTYPAAPDRVFNAFADEATKRRWYVEGKGWHIYEFSIDFHVGGAERSRFRFGDGPDVRNETIFQDIVLNRRIVFVYRMDVAGKPISVSLATVELTPTNGGTHLKYTEQGAFFGDPAGVEGRKSGWGGLFDKLGLELQTASSS